ncbi:CrcB family protein [Microbacterium sp. zg.B48]|uniref:fluoride efflux transporter FluC n=1 Tax=unclassified Microbacterium TaxID=2609290 RepID=UPI00214B510E|nr:MULTISPECIES: CrcB family protein [unclassified Microbacterium]MCR2764821.1 CrcB family protein [Microbacterium sp. zg.B48]MCR2810042.1 CrcB family protein [Microbacterium sp. zg.B185]WIM20118.1 CrcB family protein [Microbacterium sp. zg-B185]
MSPLVLLAVAAAGGIGSALRFVLDSQVSQRARIAFPVGTNIINATGSLALGVVTGLVAAHTVPGPVGLIVGTGLIGGYTTFSTASLETVRLLIDGRLRAAALNGIALLAVNALLAGCGILLGLLPAA